MIKPVLVYPDPRLLTKSQAVTDFPALQELLADMRTTMRWEKGLGLAANQIGDPRAVFIIDKILDLPQLVFVNPTIVTQSKTQVNDQEGCLSLPDVSLWVDRPKHVTMRAQDQTGKPFEIKASGYVARALLHEFDHLDGKLFTRLAKP